MLQRVWQSKYLTSGTAQASDGIGMDVTQSEHT